MRVFVIILMFFLFSALFIISNNNLAFYQKENITTFSELYQDWLNQIYLNLQTITGQATKMAWFPE